MVPYNDHRVLAPKLRSTRVSPLSQATGSTRSDHPFISIKFDGLKKIGPQGVVRYLKERYLIRHHGFLINPQTTNPAKFPKTNSLSHYRNSEREKLSRWYYFLMIAAAALLMSACATPNPCNHIDLAARPHFDAVDTYLLVEQDNIVAGKFESNISGGTGLGFLELMAMEAAQRSIEEKTQASVESHAETIRDNLRNFDFAEVLTKKLNTTLREIEWLNAKDMVLLRHREKDLFLTKCASSIASATLFVGAQYWISPDLSDVRARVESIMFPNVESLEAYKANADGNENPVDETDNIYLGRFTMRVPLKVEGLVKDRASKLARNEGEKVKAALTKCAAMVADYLGRDLGRDERDDQKRQ